MPGITWMPNMAGLLLVRELRDSSGGVPKVEGLTEDEIWSLPTQSSVISAEAIRLIQERQKDKRFVSILVGESGADDNWIGPIHCDIAFAMGQWWRARVDAAHVQPLDENQARVEASAERR